MNESIQIKSIGRITSCFKEKFATPRQGSLSPSSYGYIELDLNWQPELSLQNLNEFSHIWVIFHFHETQSQFFQAKVSPPRISGKKLGVFSTRSPHRPNPIGLSLVKLERIEKNKVYISGIDIIHGTPVIDIKPYIEEYDFVPRAQSGWVHQVEPHSVLVNFSKDLESKINPEIKKILSEVLAQDVRPQVQKNHDKVFKTYIENFNISFRYDNPNSVTVFEMVDLEADE